MNCFERENRIWEKRLSDPLKLHQNLAKRLDSDRQTIVPRITAQQQTALKRDQSLYATRLRYGYQAILDLETALQKKRQAQRAVRLLRRVPKLFGRRRPAPIRTIEKVAGAIEKMSIREMQARLCRMKQSYRADHHIYCQHYGDPTLQTHAHQNTHVQVHRTRQSL
jgi:anti-sigma factor RsiW